MADATTGGAGGLLGTLYINITAKTDELEKNVDKGEKKVKESSKHMEEAIEGVKEVVTALGLAFGLHEIIHFVEDTIKATDELKKFSTELDIGIDKLAALKFSADKANIGEQFEMGMRRFANALREAQVEGSAAQTLFNNLDVNPKQGVDKAFDQVVSKFHEWEDGVNKMGIAEELFGTRNAKFVNLLSQGSEELSKDTQELADLIGVSWDEAAKKAADYEDATTEVKYALKGLALEFINTALPSVTDFKKEIAENLPMLREFAKILGEGIPFVISGAVMAFKGFLGALKVVAIAILGVTEACMRLGRFIAEQLVLVFEFWANAGIKAINFLIEGFNTMTDKLPDWIKKRLGINGSTAVEPIELFHLRKPKGLDEWIDVVSDARKDLQNQLALDFDETAKVVKVGNEEVKKALESGPGGKRGSGGQAPNAAVLKDMSGKLNDLTGDVGFTKTTGGLRSSIGDITGIKGDSNGSYAFQNQTKEVDTQLKEIQKIRDSHIKITEEQDKRLTEIEKLYAQKRQAIVMQEASLRLQTAGNMFGDLAEISKAWAGEQSGLYKTMFAISKAFAIADATVKIAQGIAAAAANPWPLNLFAMASVVAATASIVSSIQSVQLAFGGQREEGGPVDPNHSFLVGEAGPEMFVPKQSGTIIPNDQLMGGARAPKVIVNNYTDAKPSVESRNENGEQVIEVLVKRVEERIGSNIRDGRGPTNKAMTDTFGLTRGRNAR